MQEQSRPLFFLHANRTFARRIRDASSDRFSMERVKDWSHLRTTMESAPPAALVLVDPFYGTRSKVTPARELQEILNSFPSSTVLAAMESPPTHHQVFWKLGEWGISEIVQTDDDASEVALRRRLRETRAQPLRRLLASEQSYRLTGRARTILDAAVETVMRGEHPRELAETLGFSPSTLLRWCQRSQLPTPRRLLLWMRILFASALLDDPGHSVSSVGKACGYSGDQALRRAIRAILPYTPSELREMGAFETVSQAFFAELEKLHDPQAEKR
ncbi:MAG: helix-turn-helix domain-containing protein [Gemmatimonadales bacterium]|nr:MAG: helix-turn-helix domain-containing protein [Gemmatimonadales bacterium]